MPLMLLLSLLEAERLLAFVELSSLQASPPLAAGLILADESPLNIIAVQIPVEVCCVCLCAVAVLPVSAVLRSRGCLYTDCLPP
ncbi:hypothetical protein J3F83DRAFT_739989 [Trichoderma novae-zelandiae]